MLLGLVFLGLLGFVWLSSVSPTISLTKTVFLASESVTAVMAHASADRLKAEVVTSDGDKTGLAVEVTASGSDALLTIPALRALTPGGYVLKVTDAAGRQYSQDFSWGVLALNMTKSVYASGETVEVQMAVLNQRGAMVCDAEVRLVITSPTGKSQTLSTTEDRIKVNPSCTVKDFTEEPDYEASFEVAEPGRYDLKLTAVTADDSFTITDTLTVQQPVADPLIITRQSATRIYPVNTYPVHMTVTTTEDFNGTITETVPYSFEISPLEETVSYSYEQFNRKGAVNEQYKQLHWQDVSLKKGQSITLGYQYDAPNESPNFFLAGPLSATTSDLQSPASYFTEPRSWQIAVDAVLTAIEQQITITNQAYQTNSQSPAPTDNSLGLVQWDEAAYSNAEVYLEARLGQQQSAPYMGDITSHATMDCPAADDCKIAYYDAVGGDLRFRDCDDAVCSTGTIVLLDGNVGCVMANCSTIANVGQFASIDCPAADDCKIAYYDTTNQDLRFIDCNDGTCSTGTNALLDGRAGCVLTGCAASGDRGAGVSIDCVASSDCKIAYQDTTSTALRFADCNTAGCSSGVVSLLDGVAGCVLTGCATLGSSGQYQSIRCLATDDCKIAYYSATLQHLRFADCDTANCSAGTVVEIDGSAGCVLEGCLTNNIGMYVSMDCLATDDCKIAYYDTTGSDLRFADCDTATCSSGFSTLIDGGAGCVLSGCVNTNTLGRYPDISCVASDDCKISYGHYSSFLFTYSTLLFADCDTSSCSSGSVSILDNRGSCVLTGCNPSTTGSQATNSSIICMASDDCKVSYTNPHFDSLHFADCSAANCSSGQTTLVDGAYKPFMLGRPSMSCPQSDNCKIIYLTNSKRDGSERLLKFKDCDDVQCDTGTIVVLDGAMSCMLDNCSDSRRVGQNMSLDCPSSANCKITYYDETNMELRFVNCNGEVCGAGATILIDGGPDCALANCVSGQDIGDFPALDCPTADNCKVAYYQRTPNGGLRFADCDNADCSAGTVSVLDGQAACALTGCLAVRSPGAFKSISCPAADDCKIAYHSNNDSALYFADCDDEACSSGTVALLDGAASCSLSDCTESLDVREAISMDCLVSDDCKIAYHDYGNSDLRFIDCNNATCSIGSSTLLDGRSGCVLTGCNPSGSNGLSHSISCLSTDDCKISYYSTTSQHLRFADCNNADCSTGTVSLLDGFANCTLSGCSSSNDGQFSSALDCSLATDCKIAYTSSTVLRFADCDSAGCTSGSMATADRGYPLSWLQLYSTAGVAIPDAIVSKEITISGLTASEPPMRLKSHSLSLTDATAYTVRAWTSTPGLTTAIHSAKLIVKQNNGGGITATQTMVEVGAHQVQTGTNGWGMLDSPKMYYYNPANFSGTVAVYFEATLGAAVSNSYAALSSDPTCASRVAGSEVSYSTMDFAWVLRRSSALTLPAGQYHVCMSGAGVANGVANAKLIIATTGSLDKTQTVQQLVVAATEDNDAAYTPHSNLVYLDKSNYAGDDSYYYLESVMKTSSGTGSVQLYNESDSAIVDDSELTTTSSVFERVFSQDLEADLATAKNYQLRLKGGSSNTVSVSSAWLVVQVSLNGAYQEGSLPPPVTGPSMSQLMKNGLWWKDGVKQPYWLGE